MPEIIIAAAGSAPGQGGSGLLLRERVNVTDFESERFAANLLERIEWAVRDATELERRGPITGRVKPVRQSEPEPTPERPHAPEPEPVGVS